MLDHDKKPKQINFNTIVSFIILGAVTWVGVSLTQNTKDINEVKTHIAVMEATIPYKTEQMNRLETEQSRQRSQLTDIQQELQRIKTTK